MQHEKRDWLFSISSLSTGSYLHYLSVGFPGEIFLGSSLVSEQFCMFTYIVMFHILQSKEVKAQGPQKMG